VTSPLPTPSIFDSFNARPLDPSQVAATFVPSIVYRKLSKRRHSIIVGPRGSGKTTLLKMLQQSALESWPHAEADAYRARIDFTGIFVPADIIWSEQLRSLGTALDEQAVRILGNAAFTTHILRALLKSIINRTSDESPVGWQPFRRVKLGMDSLATLARSVAEAWYLKIPIPSLLAVEHELGVRMSRIYEIASREATVGHKDRAARLASVNFLHLHFLQSSATAIDAFNNLAGE
jgi:energy-coupling factor transporter ATP-binding protein EcfA2